MARYDTTAYKFSYALLNCESFTNNMANWLNYGAFLFMQF